MNSRFLPITALLVLFLMIIVPSCRGEKEKANNVDMVKTDSVLAANSNAIYAFPLEAAQSFEKIQNEITDSQCYYRLELFKGIAQLLVGNADAYELSHKKTAEFLKRTPDSYYVEGIYWNHKGMVHGSNGNPDSAIACYEKSSVKMAKAEKWENYSNVCINLADLYRSIGDLASSARTYRRALYVADSIKNHSLDMSILSGLGAVYADMENFEQADLFFNKAKPLLDSATSFEEFFYYNSFGNNLYFQNRYDEALEKFHKAYKVAQKLEQQDLLGVSETNLGEVMLYKGCIDSARYYLKSAEKRFENLPMIDESTKFYINSILMGLALSENNMVDAHKYLSVNMDTLVLRPKYVALHYRRLQMYYVYEHDYKKAYEYEKLADKYDRKVNSDKLNNQLTEIQYRYAQDSILLHKNHMIEQQKEEMEQLIMWNYVAVGVIVFLVIIVCLYRAYQKKSYSIKKLEMERSLMSLRMENIRNRVSPHFIFNVLNRELKTENEGVNRLVMLMRRNLDLCDRYIVSLREEIDFINTYVAIEHKAIGEGFVYDVNIDENVDLDNYCLPSMMVQIFVENALKHGLRGVEGEKWLKLNISHVTNALEIKIENNGSNHGVKAGRVGTGLKVVMQTIHILNERNASKIKIDYGVNDDSVWMVKIVIPDGYNFSIMQ